MYQVLKLLAALVTCIADEETGLLVADERTVTSGTDPSDCHEVLIGTTSGLSSKFTHELARNSPRPVPHVWL